MRWKGRYVALYWRQINKKKRGGKLLIFKGAVLCLSLTLVRAVQLSDSA